MVPSWVTHSASSSTRPSSALARLDEPAADLVPGPGGRAVGDLDLRSGRQGVHAEPLGRGAEEGVERDRPVGDDPAELGGGRHLGVDVEGIEVARDLGIGVDHILRDHVGNGGKRARAGHQRPSPALASAIRPPRPAPWATR